MCDATPATMAMFQRALSVFRLAPHSTREVAGRGPGTSLFLARRGTCCVARTHRGREALPRKQGSRLAQGFAFAPLAARTTRPVSYHHQGASALRRGLATGTAPKKSNYLVERAKIAGAITAGALGVGIIGYGMYRTTQFMSSLTFVHVSSFGFYVGGVVSAGLMLGAFYLARRYTSVQPDQLFNDALRRVTKHPAIKKELGEPVGRSGRLPWLCRNRPSMLQR